MKITLLKRLLARLRKKHSYALQPFKDKAGKWRWRTYSTVNGQVVQTSGEDYSDKTQCMDSVHAFANDTGLPIEMSLVPGFQGE